MRGLLRVLLGPLLLWQGRSVRRAILRLPEADGPRDGTAGQGAPLSLLILGDSSAAGVGAATQTDALVGQLVPLLAARHRVRWRVLATTGWTTADALQALTALETERFDVAVLALGVNDVTTETGLGAWTAHYESLAAQLAQAHGARHLIFSGLPPMGRFPALPQPLRWYLGLQADAHDRALAKLADRRDDADHVVLPMDQFSPTDTAEDGFHPGPPIYAFWAQQVAQQILARTARPD